VVVGLLIAAARAACPDTAAALAEAEAALFEGRLDEASERLDDVEQAFGCALVSPTDLARFWVAEGARLWWKGDAGAAAIAFRAAARVSPDTFDPTYGQKIRAAWEAERGARAPAATLLLAGGAGRATFLDGRPTLFPASVPAGLHLVQAGRSSTAIEFGRVVDLPPGVTLELDLPAPAPAPVAVAPAPLPAPAPAPLPAPGPPKQRPIALLAATGLTATAAGVASVLALQQNPAMDVATSVDELDRAYHRQVMWGVTAYTLMGVTAAGATAYVLW